jgi:N6-adenosine-specific RNA methylase IME4/ParB-like chromosome segregation protein Spo0J
MEKPMEFHEVVSIWPRLPENDFQALVADIKTHGLIEPIWTYQGKIIDGRHRYLACQQAGVEPRYREWNGQGSLVAFVVSLNQHRRHLESSQRAVIALEIERLFALEAKEKEKRRKEASTFQIFEKSIPVLPQTHATEQAATIMQTNRQYVSDAKRIQREAPELVSLMRDGVINLPDAKRLAARDEQTRKAVLERVTTGKARKVVEAIRDVAEEKYTQMATASPATPQPIYQCLVIDPPWPMQKIARDVRPHQAEFDYPTMTEEELRAFPVPAFAAEQCHLYLWTTQKYLPMALRLAEHWGFHYQCLLTWIKNVGFTPFSWMYSTEHVLFCTKGQLPLLRMGLRLDFTGKVREHSRKPDEFYELVKQASPGPRLDIFSREKREGFDQYGNEVDKYVAVSR